MRSLFPAAALALAAAPLSAHACSVAAGYRVPTNMELVEGADLILLGTVTAGESDDAGQQMVAIEPVEALKGAMPSAPIALPAMIATDDTARLSNPYELEEAHPQSLAGACVRYIFPRGSRVLFFLDREDGDWQVSGGPFSRWAEDVLTDDAPWLQAVRFYAAVAKLPEAERAAALAARREELAAIDDDPVAQLIAADIGRQLEGPNAPLRDELPPPDDAADSAADAAADAADAAPEPDPSGPEA